jgi:hypothetical protein
MVVAVLLQISPKETTDKYETFVKISNNRDEIRTRYFRNTKPIQRYRCISPIGLAFTRLILNPT